MNLMQYQEFYGSVEVALEDGCLYGKLQFIEPLVSYEGETPAQLEAAFRKAVDDYMDDCQKRGIESQKPYKGSFNVRVGRDLHRLATVEAKRRGKNLNEFVRQAIEHEIEMAQQNPGLQNRRMARTE